MRPDDPARDPAYFEDMLAAAEAVRTFVHGRTREDYARDLMLRSAVERQVEIIGEAARKVSEQARSVHAQIPWRAIQAQRHRLAHEYGEINDDLIWVVATVHVPALIEQLRPLVPGEATTAAPPDTGAILQRMVDAVEDVRQRLLRACAALRSGGVDYAVIGGNAVAAWVATVDKAAVRNTQDVDILLRRADLEPAKRALAAAGFIYRKAAGLDLFLDGIGGSARQAVHIAFAEEVVKPGEPTANPGVEQSTDFGAFRVLNLESLVQIKLTAYRRKDQVHLLDLIEIGLVDRSWTARLPKVLAERLQSLLDTPDG